MWRISAQRHSQCVGVTVANASASTSKAVVVLSAEQLSFDQDQDSDQFQGPDASAPLMLKCSNTVGVADLAVSGCNLEECCVGQCA